MTIERIALPVLDMGCPGAGPSLERELRRLPGVLNIYVNPATERAHVEFDAAQVTPEQIGRALERLGLWVGEPTLR
jgi:P-type Cu+ transporter